MSITLPSILARLNSMADPAAAQDMARFGINPQSLLGVSMPQIRALAAETRRQYRRHDQQNEALHPLAAGLWASGLHEARILASLVDLPALVTPEQMESWVTDFDSWDVCDQVCGNLFERTPYAASCALAWSSRPETFVKRAGFVLMAEQAHNRAVDDDLLASYLVVIERESGDERNFVKKAVNWALRQIGKRNAALNPLAIACAERIRQQPSPSARWIAADALRELQSEAVQSRIVKALNENQPSAPDEAVD